MRVKAINPEVYYSDEHIVTVSRSDIAFLKTRSAENARSRSRLCAHPSVEDRLHEMLIIHMRDTYVRPHKHLGKSESFHVIEGKVALVFFDDAGAVTKALQVGDYESGLPFYIRTQDEVFHTLLIQSDIIVFHETTNGPFRPADTVFAPWSPEDKDQAAVAKYVRDLKIAVAKFQTNEKAQ